MSRKAIVTFVVGDKYQQDFEIFRPSVERYAKKYNWDFIVLEEFFEPVKDRRYIMCQKLLITQQEWSKKYDVIAWVDSDMWFTENCPELPVPSPGKIGISKEQLFHNEVFQREVCRRRGWQNSNKEYYSMYGLDDGPDWCMNAGLMVFRTDFDTRPMYEEMVSFVEKFPVRAENGTLNNADQPYLGWKLYQQNTFEFLDWRFNVVWPIYRCLFVEPYDNPDYLVKPMNNLMDIAYTIHFTDREDTNVLIYLLERIHRFNNQTLVVEKHELETFNKWFVRFIKFDKVIFRCSDEELLNSGFHINQYGWALPKNFVFSHTEQGTISLLKVIEGLK